MPTDRDKLLKLLEDSLVGVELVDDTFDAKEWLDDWLTRPCHALGGISPGHYLLKPDGCAQVAKVIGAMFSGSYL